MTSSLPNAENVPSTGGERKREKGGLGHFPGVIEKPARSISIENTQKKEANLVCKNAEWSAKIIIGAIVQKNT